MTAQLPSRERLSDDLLGQIAFYAGEAICHPDPNYALEYQKLAYPANVLALVNEVIAARALLAAHEQEPVGIVHGVAQTLDGSSFVTMVECKTRLSDGTELFSHRAPVPALPDECHKCNGTGMMDSGGVQPWGEPVQVICDCRYEAPTTTPAPEWTDNSDANAALVMLDRIDTLDPADDDRIEEVKQIIRSLAAPTAPDGWMPEEKGSSLQLRNLIRQRHAEWSQKTFGNVGPVGPLKHLAKEAIEAADEPDDLSEWADMQFLLWDAQRRAGIGDGEITAAMEEKLKVNMAREWPEPKDGEPRQHIQSAPKVKP